MKWGHWMSEEIEKKISIKKQILIFIVSTFWFILGNLPIVPVGAIISILLWRPRQKLSYLLIVLASLIGFIGTGFHVTAKEIKQKNLETNKEYTKYLYSAGVRYGYVTLYYLLNGNKVVVYDDPSFRSEVDQANDYLREYVRSHNNNNPLFLAETIDTRQGVPLDKINEIYRVMKDRCGDIVSTSYQGYLSWDYPNQQYADISVVHNVDFEKKCDTGSLRIRRLYLPTGPKTLAVNFINKDIKYRVVRGMKVENKFKKSTAEQ